MLDDGLPINASGIDPVSNRAVVGIKSYTDQAAEDLETRFGSEIRVVEHDMAVYP